MNWVDNTTDALRRYLKDAAASQPLSSAEEIELSRRVKRGDLDARNDLVSANLRFVISVAREYDNRGVPLDDLISAGNIGLITAAERFDETKGFKFISYAVWWIRQAVLQTLADHSRVVRLPINRVDLLRKIAKVEAGWQKTKHRSPTEEELAEELGVSFDQVQETLVSGQSAMSLHAAFGDNNDNSLLEILANSQQEPTDAPLERGAMEKEIGRALGTLGEREAEVVRLYFGIGGIQALTLEEIGVKFGLTRERVRQIKEKALRKLRHPTRGKKLLPYAEEIPGLVIRKDCPVETAKTLPRPSPPPAVPAAVSQSFSPGSRPLLQQIADYPTIRQSGGMSSQRLRYLLARSDYYAWDAIQSLSLENGGWAINRDLVDLVWRWGYQEGLPMKPVLKRSLVRRR